jgi:hypothetical protein
MKKFRPEIYLKLSLDELTTYAVYCVLTNEEICTFERLVVECFHLFPEVFSLKRYPKYPDSARVDKSWLRCRTDKGWITGSVKESFRLSDAGLRIAKQTEQKLIAVQLRGRAREPAKVRGREEAVVKFIRNHPTYLRYIGKGESFQIAEHEFRQLLSCTMETPLRVLRQNLNQVIDALEAYRELELLAFIRLCARKMSPILKQKGK